MFSLIMTAVAAPLVSEF